MDIVFSSDESFLKEKENLLFVVPKGTKSNLNVVFLTNIPSKNSFYISTGSDRTVFERGVSFISNLEQSPQNDGVFSRRSGFNQVLAKLAKKNNITLVFNYSLFLSSPQKILGRMRQNYMLCKKYNVQYIIASCAENKQQIQSDEVLKSFENLLKYIKI